MLTTKYSYGRLWSVLKDCHHIWLTIDACLELSYYIENYGLMLTTMLSYCRLWTIMIGHQQQLRQLKNNELLSIVEYYLWHSGYGLLLSFENCWKIESTYTKHFIQNNIWSELFSVSFLCHIKWKFPRVFLSNRPITSKTKLGPSHIQYLEERNRS